MNAWLALASALVWGGGDFSGGMAVKAAGGRLGAALRVVLLSHATSLCLVVAIAVGLGDPFPRGAALAWGLGAGVAGGLGVMAFYVALSRGAMGASAAVSGLLAAAIPAVIDVWVDGAPDGKKVAGFCLAGAAIWLIAGGGEAARGTIGLAALSGAAFGVFFVALKFAGSAGLAWPMATARMSSTVLCGVMLLAMRERKIAVGRAALPWVMGTAVLDTGGNILFVAATRAGRLDVASVLGSLYPASTILLAAWRLHEAPTRRQGCGMALAAGAVVLITM